MTNKKLFKSALIITAVMLSVSGCAGGCSKQTDPVIADATVETPAPEESVRTKEIVHITEDRGSFWPAYRPTPRDLSGSGA